MINEDDSVKQLTQMEQYEQMEVALLEVEKLCVKFKKFFEEVLRKQLDLCQGNSSLIEDISMRLQNRQQSPVDEHIKQLLQSSSQLFKNIKAGNQQQLQRFTYYLKDVNCLVSTFVKFKNDLILVGLKCYKKDEQLLRKLLSDLKEQQDGYELASQLYKQTQSDPSLLYNFELKQRRYQLMNQKLEQIKEYEYEIQRNIEIMLTRRRCICKDMIELRRIAELVMKMVGYYTYVISISNINTIIQVCSGQWANQKKIKKTHNLTILPEVSKYNFDSRSQNSRLADFQFLEKQKKLNFEDASNIDEFDRQSFHSLRDISLNQSTTSIIENDPVRLPWFLTNDSFSSANSTVIQYYEWMLAYQKDLKKNCAAVNESIQIVKQFLEGMFQMLKRAGKPCIQVPESKLSQSPLTQLKWFRHYQECFGAPGIQSLQEQIQINDLFNLYSMQLSVFMKLKIESLSTIQQQIITQQNIAFSSVDKQIKDLGIAYQDFLKSQGLLVNNRTVALYEIDSQQKRTDFDQAEKHYRQMIQVTSKATKHLLVDLDQHQCKLLKTVCEIVDSVNSQLGVQLSDVLSLQSFSINNSQQSLETNTDKILKQYHLQGLEYLRSQSAFYILYAKTRNRANIQRALRNTGEERDEIDESQLLLGDLMQDTCQQFKSTFNHSALTEFSRPPSVCGDESTDERDKALEQDKSKEEQLVFIRSKVQMEANEILHNSFSCALAEKIQLQGRLYITNKRLFFHSNFNSSNLFFGDTSLNIPRQDILLIQKRTNAYIFDNSISVQTPKGQIFFATFFTRDVAYDLIIKVFQPKEQPELLVSPNQAASIDAIKLVPLNFDAQQQELLKQRAERLKGQAEPLPIVIQETVFPFPQIPLRLFFKLIFGDKFEKQSITAYERMKLVLGCSEFQISKWSPELPLEYDSEFGKGSIINSPDSYQRSFSCRQPLPPSNIPFMPKVCDCSEVQTLYLISLEKFVLNLKVVTAKAPYADSFYVSVRYICEQTDQGVRIQCSIQNVFIKSALVQKIIEKASEDEITMKTSKHIFPFMQQELQNYLDMLNGKKVDAKLQQEPSTEKQKVHQQGKFKKMVLNLWRVTVLGVALALLFYVYVNYLSKIRISVEFA